MAKFDDYYGLADQIIEAIKTASRAEVQEMICEMRDHPTPDPHLNWRIRITCFRRLTQLGEQIHVQEKEEQGQ